EGDVAAADAVIQRRQPGTRLETDFRIADVYNRVLWVAASGGDPDVVAETVAVAEHVVQAECRSGDPLGHSAALTAQAFMFVSAKRPDDAIASAMAAI